MAAKRPPEEQNWTAAGVNEQAVEYRNNEQRREAFRSSHDGHQKNRGHKPTRVLFYKR